MKLDNNVKNEELSASTIDGSKKRDQLTCNCRDISLLSLNKYFVCKLRAYLGSEKWKQCKQLKNLFYKTLKTREVLKS